MAINNEMILFCKKIRLIIELIIISYKNNCFYYYYD